MENTELAMINQTSTGISTNVFSDPEQFKKLYDIGKMFASSSMVPQVYQGKPMDCVIAVDMANRMSVSPLMVMQNLDVVRGKPRWNGKAAKTLVESSGKFKELKHVYTGTPGTDSWGCYLQGIRISDGELVKGAEVTIKMAKDEGWYSKLDKYGKETSKWQTMPELMLAYRASTFFANVHTPDRLMGVSVEGEPEDITKSEYRAPADNPLMPKGEILEESKEVFNYGID